MLVTVEPRSVDPTPNPEGIAPDASVTTSLVVLLETTVTFPEGTPETEVTLFCPRINFWVDGAYSFKTAVPMFLSELALKEKSTLGRTGVRPVVGSGNAPQIDRPERRDNHTFLVDIRRVDVDRSAGREGRGRSTLGSISTVPTIGFPFESNTGAPVEVRALKAATVNVAAVGACNLARGERDVTRRVEETAASNVARWNREAGGADIHGEKSHIDQVGRVQRKRGCSRTWEWIRAGGRRRGQIAGTGGNAGIVRGEIRDGLGVDIQRGRPDGDVRSGDGDCRIGSRVGEDSAILAVWDDFNFLTGINRHVITRELDVAVEDQRTELACIELLHGRSSPHRSGTARKVRRPE